MKAFYTARLPSLGVIITLWTPGTVSGEVVAYETGYFRPGATPLFVHLAFDDTQLGNGITFLDITVADHP